MQPRPSSPRKVLPSPRLLQPRPLKVSSGRTEDNKATDTRRTDEQYPRVSSRLSPTPSTLPYSDTIGTSNNSTITPPIPFTQATADRIARDEFLLVSKRKGMTYREIRAAGGFTEAESTLRGRYRTLTKSREERVRKPEWSEKDIELLKKAVRKFTRGMGPEAAKVPWKQVAEYIHQKGGSYLFGNATCRKKWDELAVAER
ncbi:hypothetical protein SODALDRAFT_328556 [Sodiomyces alkalinus F11]|uniref:Myb-like domain-containing protein n=1 Tax=Sodiomyces alkalinus (strain CBS 110278 / VKM F-3762 / F11) TaxID=1314773 RepID=A0A3N2PP47_SODAK|nr:hypothetical protein SODALDRAFT_328556 [Sodiomyces alkalinus F11]ROT36194.1 hypothetical protein SODALDRAFT_328556 [Sodiomyces alkalinus F11]